MATPQQKAEFLRLQEANIPKLIQFAKDTANWDILTPDENGVCIAQKEVDGKMPIIRGTGIVKAPPPVVLDTLWPVEKRSQWDESCDKKKNKVVEKLDGQSDVRPVSETHPFKPFFPNKKIGCHLGHSGSRSFLGRSRFLHLSMPRYPKRRNHRDSSNFRPAHPLSK